MLIDLTEPGTLSVGQIGGKAYNLHKLTHMGVPVPPAVVVPADVTVAKEAELRTHISTHPIITVGEKFAVRSSGIGEDGEGNSFAGIFESYLDVSREDIYDAVVRVWESVNSTRSAMYAHERSTSVGAMGVVIQHMIDADYAGVAFSVCPVEKDKRIALIEMVAGNGDSLVSGKKTPATIRVNKLTDMTRIQRQGADKIAPEVLEQIAEELMPLIVKIERSYGVPVDIEWAYAQGEPYILQARPITT